MWMLNPLMDAATVMVRWDTGRHLHWDPCMPSCIGVFDCLPEKFLLQLQSVPVSKEAAGLVWFSVAAVGIPTEGLHLPVVVHTSLLGPQHWCPECLSVRYDVCILWKSLFNSPQLCCVEVNQDCCQ